MLTTGGGGREGRSWIGDHSRYINVSSTSFIILFTRATTKQYVRRDESSPHPPVTVTLRLTPIVTYWTARRKSVLSIHMGNYEYIGGCKGVQFKSKVQPTGTWSVAARPPRRLCYRPPVFFHHLPLIVLPSPLPPKKLFHVSKYNVHLLPYS
jgi:hypothetical protein